MVINGRQLADEILTKLKHRIQTSGRQLKLAAILIGGNPMSRRFLELKQKTAEYIGVEYEIHELAAADTEELAAQIQHIANDPSNQGVIIELPLPAHLDTQRILDAVPGNKDVDALSREAADRVLSPAAEAVSIILNKYNINPAEKKVVLIGHGLLIGRPIEHWLSGQGIVPEIIDEFTPTPAKISRTADILITGVGKAGLITANMVKPGAVVIDFGYENVAGRAVGDVDFEAVAPIASLITPVPNGCGPIVIAAVFKNLLLLNGIHG